MHDLIKDTLERLKVTSEEKPKMLCKVFEDSQVACHPAPNQQFLVGTKCFVVKCLFSLQFVCDARKNPKGWLNAEKCSANLMNTDHLTKGLAGIKFDADRFQIQGW